MTLEEILRREGPMIRTNIAHNHNTSSDESSDSNETHESDE